MSQASPTLSLAILEPSPSVTAQELDEFRNLPGTESRVGEVLFSSNRDGFHGKLSNLGECRLKRSGRTRSLISSLIAPIELSFRGIRGALTVK